MIHTTERLFIPPAGLDELNKIVEEDWPGLSAALGGVTLAEGWLYFPESMVWMRNYLKDHLDEAPWWGHLLVHRQDIRLIGACGYKGCPTPEGTVEIGYGIAPGYQNQGLATEAARALIDHAFRQEVVKMVLAHTLAEENASCAVLRKLGFSFAGEVFDIEDGRIWRWELPRPEVATQTKETV